MNKLDNWQTPENSFRIPKNEAHVWRLPLELKTNELDKANSFLFENELVRAQRFYFDKHRNHYIAARAQMRMVLSQYLNQDNKDIEFSYNEFGKPFFENNAIHFNLSHSHNLALLAVNLEYELGVDIEWMKRKTNLLKIGERFFSGNEYAELKSLPAQFQRQGFFNCWTRKESYIKARGKGLMIPLSEFEVSLLPGEPARLKSTLHDPEGVKRWSLYTFDPHPDYAAALTINTARTKISLWDGSFLLSV